MGTIAAPPGAHWTTVTSAARGKITFAVRLPKKDFIAGEAVSPELVLRNAGTSPVEIFDPRVIVTDENGRPYVPRGFVPGRFPGSRPGPSSRRLDPGQSYTRPQDLQLPFSSDVDGHSYQLRGVVQIAGPGPRPKNVARWPRLETPAYPLALAAPKHAQRLQATWAADRQQWCLSATAATGQHPAAPLTLWIWVRSARGAEIDPVLGTSGYRWDGTWTPFLLEGNRSLVVQLWIAGPGYVTLQLTKKIAPDAE